MGYNEIVNICKSLEGEMIQETVENYLTKEGFVIVTASDGEEAINKFMQVSFVCFILDIMMLKIDGLEVMKWIRDRSAIPILMMSAKDTNVDKAIGLGLGADDYILPPFL